MAHCTNDYMQEYRRKIANENRALLALLEQFPRLLRRQWEEGQIMRLQGFVQSKAYCDALNFANEVLARGPDAGKTEAAIQSQIESENYEDKHGHAKFKGRNPPLNLPVVPRVLSGPFVPNALTEEIKNKKFSIVVEQTEKKKE